MGQAQKMGELLLLDVVSGETSGWCSGYNGLVQGRGEYRVEEMVQEKIHLREARKGQVKNNRKGEISWAWRKGHVYSCNTLWYSYTLIRNFCYIWALFSYLVTFISAIFLHFVKFLNSERGNKRKRRRKELENTHTSIKPSSMCLLYVIFVHLCSI